MTLVTSLNPTSLGDLGGTDLGIPSLRPNGETLFTFGDTFGGSEAKVGGPNWRSPVMLRSRTRDLSQPITFESACRAGAQVIDYRHNDGGITTKLPCDVVSVGDRMYLWVMATAGLGHERWTEIHWSDDDGESWHDTGVRWNTDDFGGKRIMVTWEKDPYSQWVYIVSTGGLARDKNALLWRVHAARIEDFRAWSGWGWNGHDWGWDRTPTDILPGGTKLGEICLRWIQGNWVLSGFDAADYSVFVKIGSTPIADWMRAPTYRPVTGLPRARADRVNQLYGGYVHPHSRFDGAFCLIVSEWNTARNDPYRAMQFTVTGIEPVAPLAERPQLQEAPMTVPTTDYDVGRELADATYNPTSRQPMDLWAAMKRILFETTLWQKERTVEELDAQAGFADSLYGHCVRAGSWGRHNWDKLEKIGRGVLDTQAKLDKVLRNQQKIGAALNITDLEE